MERKIVLCVAIFVFCVGVHVSNATICKPLSKFKLDCNTCFCSRDGARYACTRKTCRGEPIDFQFINDEGVEDDLPINNINEKEVRIPFINDEIPPSKEEWDDDTQNDDDYVVAVRNEIDDPRFDRPIQDVDTDDQEVEDMNEYNRFKREIYV